MSDTQPPLSVKAAYARQTIADAIASGRYKPGERLPSERQLAEDLGMNHLTLRRALTQLVAEGLIEKQPGVGNFVRSSGRGRFATGIGILLARRLFSVSSHAAAAPILTGVHDVLDAEKFNVQTLVYDRDTNWDDLIKLVTDKGIRGVLLHPIAQVKRDQIQRLADAGIKLVMLNPSPVQVVEGVAWAKSDPITPLLQIFDRLLSLGHERISVVLYEFGVNRFVRVEAIGEYCAQHNLNPSGQDVVLLPNPGDQADLSPLAALVERIRTGRGPTAVILPDEINAHHLMNMLDRAGLSVPRDVSIAVLENNASWFNRMPLTGPDSGLTRSTAAAQAATMLREWLEGREPVAAGLWISAPVIWTDSIAAPASTLPVSRDHSSFISSPHASTS